jgi:cytochrome c-type biogenesis protein
LPIAAILVLSSVAWAGQPFDAKAFQSSQAAGKAILVDITAPWCPTCKQQRPIVEEIKERPDLVVCKVDFDTAKDVLKRFRVQYQSTLSSGVRRKSRARRARPIRRRSVRSSRRRSEVSANLALGYAAGALSTLSPCVLPILPIVLFGAIERNVWGPLALAAGLAASFASVGIAVASVGFSIGIDPTILRLVVAALLGGAGIVLLVPELQGKVVSFATPVATRGQILLDRLQPSGVRGQFALGALLGVIWLPCSGPTLGAAVPLAAQGDSLGTAALTMAAFALGAATPILVLAYGSRLRSLRGAIGWRGCPAWPSL